jgi:2-polyprenyl-3-methyl-5-hydroxy-6-metoxy-1,4-benzoquinol methylase
MNLQQHWEKVYQTKQLNEVSWYQQEPSVSLLFLEELNISKDATIIDIGGGDSLLVDHLLRLGYSRITVLDISATAIEKAKKRLGNAAAKIKWIVADAKDFTDEEQYDFWHDRAAFHFLTTEDDVKAYLQMANKHIKPKGKMVIGTFSDSGPDKCSGLPVQKYKEESLTAMLSNWFQKIKCITSNHITPFNTIQNFLFCSFSKTGF